MSDDLRSLRTDALRVQFVRVQEKVAALRKALDDMGAGDGVAIMEVDEAHELLERAEATHFKTTNPRTTDAVERAVEMARAARATRIAS